MVNSPGRLKIVLFVTEARVRLAAFRTDGGRDVGYCQNVMVYP